MLIFKRATPYWTTLSSMLLLWLGVTQPGYWWLWSIVLAILPIVVIVIMRQPHWRYEYVGLTLPMLMLLLGGFTFLLIQEQWLIQLIVVIVTGTFFFLFQKNLSVFLFEPAKYIPFSLEHISIYSTVLASFYVYVSLFIFSILRLTRLRYIFIAALVLSAMMIWQTFWIQKIAWQKARWFVLVLSVVLTEVVVALYYWPVSFFVSGITMTLLMYVLLHLSRHHLTNTLTRQIVIRYCVTAAVALVLLLVSADWYYH
ncbi:MAG: hypothetical protein ACD_41C00142G0002 [uncultured bacterium]|nr:MAG: hypothetical protein ACD_41C00142G0002 [uncultured bacterium]